MTSNSGQLDVFFFFFSVGFSFYLKRKIKKKLLLHTVLSPRRKHFTVMVGRVLKCIPL